MKFYSTALCLVVSGWLTVQGLARDQSAVPAGHGQLENAPKLFRGGVDAEGREFYLNGQSATRGKLVLTASNGFFDSRVCIARGKSDLPKVGDSDLIGPNFAYLDSWRQTGKTIRWHIWLDKPGIVHFSVNMKVTEAQAGSAIRVVFGGAERTVKTVVSDADIPQPWSLRFEAPRAGEHTLSLSAVSIAHERRGVGQLHTVDVYGSAIENAKLLRARWRPTAAHGGYESSSCRDSRLWVMATRSVRETSSYSPITTPFGYFGTSFGADRRSNGQFNFSMWAGGRNAKSRPLDQMPHLLAVGSPQAEFSGFGHEGTGVKIRGWQAMPDRPEVVIQALRMVVDGAYCTYYGYFWNHPTGEWKLYAAGRKWSPRPPRHLRPGSFCEVPGPPRIQRSGDNVREVRRYGWYLDRDRKWQVMDKFAVRSKGTQNKSWYTTAGGEFAMSTGGMRYYKFSQPSAGACPDPRPGYLSEGATKQLFALPVEFGDATVAAVTDSTAVLKLDIKEAGDDAEGILYYGERDCLTFAKRGLHATERGSSLARAAQDAERCWQHQIRLGRVRAGRNPVKLVGLTPGKKYYYRAMIVNRSGKVWDFHSREFRTAGAAHN